MTSSNPGWMVVECPACQTALKAPSGAETHRLQCPGCGCFVRIGPQIDGKSSVSGIEEPVPIRRGLSILPTERSFDPDPETVRGREREEWEPGNTPLHPPDFTAPLHTTLDADIRIDPATKRKERRLHRHEDQKLPWDEKPGTSAWENRRIQLARIYKAILAALVVVAVALTFAWWMKLLFHRGAGTLEKAWLAASQTVATLREQKEGSPERPRLFPDISERDYAEAIAVMARFLKASTIDEVLSVVREPERVEPLLRAYYRENPVTPMDYRRLPRRHELQAFKNFVSGAAEGPNFESPLLAVQRVPRPMKVDWEASVGYCEVSWEKLPEVRPTTPTLLRARLAKDDYFNYTFSDEAAWECFRLSSLWEEHHLYAYAQRGTPLAMELARRTRQNRLSMVSVRIRFPEKGAPNQAELTELVADGWLVHGDNVPIATQQTGQGDPRGQPASSLPDTPKSSNTAPLPAPAIDADPPESSASDRPPAR
ncbi:MAG: hypothetical protein ACR2OZ_06750 [Verrucomicrobiales bacterium]